MPSINQGNLTKKGTFEQAGGFFFLGQCACHKSTLTVIVVWPFSNRGLWRICHGLVDKMLVVKQKDAFHRKVQHCNLLFLRLLPLDTNPCGHQMQRCITSWRLIWNWGTLGFILSCRQRPEKPHCNKNQQTIFCFFSAVGKSGYVSCFLLGKANMNTTLGPTILISQTKKRNPKILTKKTLKQKVGGSKSPVIEVQPRSWILLGSLANVLWAMMAADC